MPVLHDFGALSYGHLSFTQRTLLPYTRSSTGLQTIAGLDVHSQYLDRDMKASHPSQFSENARGDGKKRGSESPTKDTPPKKKSPNESQFSEMLLCSQVGGLSEKVEGQQLKGKIVSELFFTLFSHFFTLFRIFPPRPSPSKQRVLAQREQKRRKDNKKNRTMRCCMLVVARLSSS